jgi:hypothetical protein
MRLECPGGVCPVARLGNFSAARVSADYRSPKRRGSSRCARSQQSRTHVASSAANETVAGVHGAKDSDGRTADSMKTITVSSDTTIIRTYGAPRRLLRPPPRRQKRRQPIALTDYRLPRLLNFPAFSRCDSFCTSV